MKLRGSLLSKTASGREANAGGRSRHDNDLLRNPVSIMISVSLQVDDVAILRESNGADGWKIRAKHAGRRGTEKRGQEEVFPVPCTWTSFAVLMAQSELSMEEVDGGMIGTQPGLMPQEAVDLIGQDELLEVDSLPAERTRQRHVSLKSTLRSSSP